MGMSYRRALLAALTLAVLALFVDPAAAQTVADTATALTVPWPWPPDPIPWPPEPVPIPIPDPIPL